MDLRLVPAAATSWAVTASGILWPWSGAVAALAAAVTTTAAAGWWGLRRVPSEPGRTVMVPSVLAVALVGVGFAVAVTVRTDAVRDHPISTYVGSITTVTVTPSESPRLLDGGRTMMRGSLTMLDGVESSGTVLVFAPGGKYAALAAGQPAAFRAAVARPTRRDLTVAVLSAQGEPVLGDAAPVHRVAHHLRTHFAESARLVLPADQAALLPALVLGDTSAVPAETTAQFRQSGLAHLTAVSGANVTIVCGAVLMSAVLIGPRAAVILAAVTLVAFVIVVQPSPSVLRAAVMGAITLLAVVSHRRRQALPALSATVIALMIGAPQLAVDVGFALSVSATAALIVIAPVWSRRLADRGWPRPLADAVSVAVAAQLVTAPLVAGISGSVSLVAVLANLIATPVIAPITVIGTAAAALSGVWPAGAQLLVRFAGPEVWWLLGVARWATRVPAASLPVPSGMAGVLCVAGASIAAAVVWHWVVSARRGTIER